VGQPAPVRRETQDGLLTSCRSSRAAVLAVHGSVAGHDHEAVGLVCCNVCCYFTRMFEWDEQKNDANIQKHGVAFDDVIPVFFSKQVLVVQDDRKDYGEDRFIILCPGCFM
jgi:hypothetical protein